jgi:cyclic pyranopterin phosphate synthase
MYDPYKRSINYLRISVTDRCNLRCRYCMPEEGVELMPHDEILSFSQIVEVVKEGVKNGISKIRLTGGEPLVRKGIVELVGMIAAVDGVEDLSMTTNGILLEKYAHDLAVAGLKRVNVSLDTTNAERYRYITRGGDIRNVFAGIEAAKNAGLTPIKINCVVNGSKHDEDALSVAEFGEIHGYQVRYIHQMDLETGTFSKVDGGDGGNCASCNRLRLTADGKIRPCLFNSLGYSVKNLGVAQAYAEAVYNKPLSGTRDQSGKFYGIGG